MQACLLFTLTLKPTSMPSDRSSVSIEPLCVSTLIDSCSKISVSAKSAPAFFDISKRVLAISSKLLFTNYIFPFFELYKIQIIKDSRIVK